MTDSAAAAAPGEHPREWEKVGGHGRLRQGYPIFFAIFLASQLALLISNLANAFDIPLWVSIGIAVAFIALSLGAAALYLRLRYPQPAVHLGTKAIRVGRETTSLSQVTTARLEVVGSKRSRTVTLVLGIGKRSIARIHLRDRRGAVLAPHECDVLVAALRLSNVAMPKNPDDPRDRFARYNFPTNITKEEAIEMVLHPPAPGDPVPVLQ